MRRFIPVASLAVVLAAGTMTNATRAADTQVTFTRDVLPILQGEKHLFVCYNKHREICTRSQAGVQR